MDRVFALCLLLVVYGRVSGQITLSGAVARGSCCTECSDGIQDCVEQYLQGIRTEPCVVTSCEFSVPQLFDGSSETGLDLNLIADNVGMSSIDLELGILYSLEEVRVERSPDVSLFLSILISQDGVNFTQITRDGNSTDNGEVVFNLSVSQGQASHVATVVRLNLDQNNVIGELPAVSEVAVFGMEIGCGVCVDQLLDLLANITALINGGFDLLPSSTSVLRQEVEDVESSVNHLEGTVKVLEVVLGIRDPLDENITLVPTVIRYDLLLTPPFPHKLEDLQTLLNNLTAISLTLDGLSIALTDIQSDIIRQLNRTRDFYERVRDIESTLNNTLSRLSEEFALFRVALNETTLIHTTITSRNYLDIITQLEALGLPVNSRLMEALTLLSEAQVLSERVAMVTMRLAVLEGLLEAARDRAVETSDRAQLALNETQRAEDLVAQINLLLSEAEELNLTIDSSLSDIVSILARVEVLLSEGRNFTQSSESLLPMLSNLLSMLQLLLDEYTNSLSAYRPPESCDPNSTPCTRGQLHANLLAENASFIVNSSESVYTLMFAREFLENIDSSGQLFNFTELNLTALRAQEIAQNALNQVGMVNSSNLLSQSNMALAAAQNVSELSVTLLQQAQNLNETVQASTARVRAAQEQLENLRPRLPPIVNRTAELLSQTGLRDEALELLSEAQQALNVTLTINESVTRIEEGLPSVALNLVETAENVRVGEDALDNAEAKFHSISTFLNATRVAGEAFVVNVSQFIAENDRIITEIDSLIAGLAGIHSRINRINSPIQLESNTEEQSYLSLQYPPGRFSGDTVQFESLDLYLWTGPTFMSPALLFYAGPTYFEGEDDIGNATSGSEDYFVVTLEDDDVVLRWQMGESVGVASTPAFRQGHSQIFISRVGSSFQVKVGVSLNGLNDITAMGNIANNSLLFRTSNRTSFFLGGWPEGAQLGVPGSVVPLSSLSPFQGQVQLLLFNGQQWGLWNVRGASDTMFLGSFFRNELATQNTWQAPRDTLSSSAAISFDGRGFLWVEQLGNVDDFNSRRRIITIITRPNSEEDGLVLYAYDPEIRLSMEVAYQRGTLRLIIRDLDRTMPLVDYQQPSTPSIVATTGRNGRRTELIFAENVGFRINDEQSFLTGEASRFFTNLTGVRVWFGGVRQDLLESPFAPEITNGSYYGCIDLFVQDNVDRNILRGNHYTRYYLNSPQQQGFSGTCLQSVYTREIGLSGEEGAYLSYPYLELVSITNSPTPFTEGVSPGVVTLSLALLPQQDSGVVLGARSGDHRLYAVLRDGVVMVGLTDSNGGHVTQSGQQPVTLGQWNYILIQLEPNQFTVYVNGLSQGPSVSVPGLNFALSTSPVTGGPGVLFLGGVDQGFVTQVDDLSPFTGCMRDFAYNFGAMSFLNPSISSSDSRYPLGVSYNTCPFFNTTNDPLLAVRPDPVQPLFCLATPPLELMDTNGGFHAQTTLTTSNVIGLFQNSWELSMLLKQTIDGHVVTIASTQGHRLSLTIEDATPTLTLADSTVALNETEASGDLQITTSGPGPIQENVFTPISIRCSVLPGSLLTCSLLVDGVIVGEPLEAIYNGTVFFPELPITLGQTEDAQGNLVNSFVGCIRSLSTNDDLSGFVNVRTDVPCYNNTEVGLGFTGISTLGTSLPVLSEEITSVEIIITFRPLLQNGLLFLVTTANLSTPVFTVGIFNGQLRISNFNISSPEGYLSFPSLSTVCNTSSPSYYTLSLVYNESSIALTVVEQVSGDMAELMVDTPSTVVTGAQLILTIGNTPAGYTVPEGSGQFLFLLSEDVSADSLPPGLVGCVRNVDVDRVPVNVETADSAEQVLVGLCASED